MQKDQGKQEKIYPQMTQINLDWRFALMPSGMGIDPSASWRALAKPSIFLATGAKRWMASLRSP